MKIITILMLLAALHSSLVVAAPKAPRCDLRVNAEPATQPALVSEIPGQLTPLALNSAFASDPKVARKAIVQSVHARRTATETVEVAARLVNCTRQPLQLQVRTHFMDEQQFPSEPETEWQRLHIQPRSMETYRMHSIGTNAVGYFLIEYRRAES